MLMIQIARPWRQYQAGSYLYQSILQIMEICSQTEMQTEAETPVIRKLCKTNSSLGSEGKAGIHQPYCSSHSKFCCAAQHQCFISPKALTVALLSKGTVHGAETGGCNRAEWEVVDTEHVLQHQSCAPAAPQLVNTCAKPPTMSSKLPKENWHSSHSSPSRYLSRTNTCL